MMNKLPLEFYTRPDVVQIAQELLGKVLVTQVEGQLTEGIIVETEAYSGRNDKACHANDGLRTARTEIMYGQGGVSYVYLCYGIHHLFNIVTNVEGLADAVLIRAVEPLTGMDLMLQRRKMAEPAYRLTAGPGSMSKALGITTTHYGLSLSGDTIWLEDRGIEIVESNIVTGIRVGVDYAGEHAKYHWRFSIKGNKWVSKAK